MEITLEQIDLLRRRANISYKEAKEVLEKCNGDIVEALAYLEEQEKIKPEGGYVKNSPIINKSKEIISRSNKTDFVIYNNEKTILNIPLTIAIIIGAFTLPFSIPILLLLVITHHRIKLVKNNGENCSVNDKIDKVSNTISSAADKVAEEFKN